MSGISRTATGATISYTTLNGPVPSGQYYGRVGFDLEGRAYVAYSSNGTNWTTFHRHDAAAPNGTYRFYMQSEATGANITSLSVGELTSTIVLNYRYIESPDGQFYHPLFASADEAAMLMCRWRWSGWKQLLLAFQDEPTGSVWYTVREGAEGVQFPPDNTVDITYVEIPTLADDIFAPSPLNISDYSFAEGSTVNIQVVPQDVPATVSGLTGTGLVYNNGYISGTAEYVIHITAFLITATRSNSYGTTNDTFNITVTDNTALSDLAGVTETQGNFIQPNRMILTHDALVQLDQQSTVVRI